MRWFGRCVLAILRFLRDLARLTFLFLALVLLLVVLLVIIAFIVIAASYALSLAGE